MSKISFSVLSKELAAMRLLVSHDESRIVLCGVHIELWPDRILLVATDGRRLGVLKSEWETDGIAEKVCFTIPDEALDRIWERSDCLEDEDVDVGPKSLLPFSNSEIPITFDTESKSISIFISDGLTIGCKSSDHPYPNWRKSIPNGKLEPLGLVSLNSKLLADFGKIGVRLTGVSGLIFRTYSSHQLIEIKLRDTDTFYGLLMLMQADMGPEQWGWLGLEKSKVE